MINKIEIKPGLCNGCKACEGQCPIENAIIIYQDESGLTEAKVNSDFCAGCGRCIGVCSRKVISFA